MFSKRISLPKLMKRINRLHEKTEKLLAKVDSEELRSEAKIKLEKVRSINNSKNLPNNATIRKEYVRCGKLDCQSKHGPYYYAYWKENGKLRKKYIGGYPPPVSKIKKKKGPIRNYSEEQTISKKLHKVN